MGVTAAAKKAAAAQSELEGQKADLKQARAHIKALERLLKRELAEGDAEKIEMAVRGEAKAEEAQACLAVLTGEFSEYHAEMLERQRRSHEMALAPKSKCRQHT